MEKEKDFIAQKSMAKSIGMNTLSKLKESLFSVLPVAVIVLIFAVTPITDFTTKEIVTFVVSAIMLILGIALFNVGADLAMTPMGEQVGAGLTKSKKLPLLLGVGFAMGVLITVAEPDLSVLAEQVKAVMNSTVLIVTVGVGVGLFLVIAISKIVFRKDLSALLIFFYMVLFALTAIMFENDKGVFLPMAFDSGGVTTGPITVPFIMALGVGIASIRNDHHAADDSFGLVALSSIGPILAVMILGIIYNPNESTYTPPILPEMQDSSELFELFRTGIPTYLIEIAVSLLPIIFFFLAAQFLVLRLSKRKLFQIGMGLVYTYIGLVLFLTGANVGFMPAGHYLGQQLASYKYSAVVIPVAMAMGYFIVRAEPAVYVLNRQVEEITDGAISAKAMGIGLSVGVSISLGLAMIRVLTGISILWFLIPGYALALIISFFVPKIYTAIAFDSGGVASGPMTAAFLLPLAQGACTAVGGNMVTDAFGVVAMVAMTPLITIQVMGLAAKLMQRRKTETAAPAAFADMDENAIIEL